MKSTSVKTLQHNTLLKYKRPRDYRDLLMVAGAGLEPATSRLWAWRAANCSTPRYILVWPLEYGIPNQPSRQTRRRIMIKQIPRKTRRRNIIKNKSHAIMRGLYVVPGEGIEPS